MKTSIPSINPSIHLVRRCILLLALGLCANTSRAQVNSGSDGHDGAFNPTQSVTIDMADRSDGIYQYTSVNIPNGVTVTFKPNASNTPVVWLVQGDCVISGMISANATDGSGVPGPGGAKGGNGGNATSSAGSGPGGGGVSISQVGSDTFGYGGSASFGATGDAILWNPFGWLRCN